MINSATQEPVTAPVTGKIIMEPVLNLAVLLEPKKVVSELNSTVPVTIPGRWSTTPEPDCSAGSASVSTPGRALSSIGQYATGGIGPKTPPPASPGVKASTPAAAV